MEGRPPAGCAAGSSDGAPRRPPPPRVGCPTGGEAPAEKKYICIASGRGGGGEDDAAAAPVRAEGRWEWRRAARWRRAGWESRAASRVLRGAKKEPRRLRTYVHPVGRSAPLNLPASAALSSWGGHPAGQLPQ